MPIYPPDFSAYYRTQATIGDLMRQQGQNQADAALRSGAIWGNALTDISRMAMALPQTIERTKAYSAERQALAADRMAQTQQRQAALAAQQRDQAETEALSGVFAKASQEGRAPSPPEIFGVVGPERGLKLMTGLQTLQQLQSKAPDFKSEDERHTVLAKLFAGLDSLPETARAQSYGPIRDMALKSGVLKPEDKAPETYDQNWWQVTRNYGAKPPDTRPEKLTAEEEYRKALQSGDQVKANQILQQHATWAGAGRAPEDNAVPALTPEGMDAAAKMYAQTGQLPPMGMGKAGAQVRAGIINRAAALNPDLNIASNKAAFSANEGSLKKLQAQTDAVTAFENTAEKNTQILDGLLKKLPDSGVRFLNTPLRAAASQLGSEDMAAFEAIRQSVQNEYGRIISNPNLAGVMSDTARKEAERLVSGDLTIGQIRSALKTLKQEAANRHSSYQTQLDQIQERMGGKKKQQQPDNDPMGIR